MAPKKCGMIVVQYEKNELFISHTMTMWRVCVDYRKLNKAIGKDILHSFHRPNVRSLDGP